MSDEHEHRSTRRWGMILLGVALLLVLTLLIAHAVWSTGARKALDRQVAVYKAAGEPILPGDFIGVALSDDENGAIDLRDAFRSIDQKSEVWAEFNKQTLDLPLVEKELTAVRAAVDANPKAFAGIDAAMKRKGVNWNIAMTSPAIGVLLPHLNEVRTLATLLGARAKLRFHESDHAGALEDLKRLKFLSDAAEQPPQVLITHLVSIGIMAMAADSAQQIAPELKIGGGAGDGAGAASKEQVAELIALLLDDTAQRAGQRSALMGERMFQLDTVRRVADGTLNLANLTGAGGPPNALASVAGFAAKPIALDDGLIMIRYTTAVRDAAHAALDWPSYQQSAPPLPPQMNSNIRHLVLRVLLPSLDNAMKTDFRQSGERRAAALSLAIRSYALEHDGKLPEKLSDLVPKYLPAVPLDPFAKNAPMKYIPDASKPIVYSVGDNGTDEDGSETTGTPRPSRSKFDAQDIVTHLLRQARRTPPAEEESIYPEEEMLDDPTTAPATQEAPQPATAPSI